MKIKLIIVVTYFWKLFPMNECKLYRIHLDDNIFPYIDKKVPFYSNYFSNENFVLEEIDDDNVQIGGYLESVKSMKRNLPVQLHIRTQYYDKARWNDGVYQITFPNACSEFLNPERLWYNITKLWDSNVCPTKIGDKWEVEPNQINIYTEVPPSIPIVPWKVYVLVYQGLPGFEVVKYGFGFRVEFLRVK